MLTLLKGQPLLISVGFDLTEITQSDIEDYLKKSKSTLL